MQSFLPDKEFEIVCGARTTADHVYLTFVPGNGSDAATAIALEFVPTDKQH